MAKKTARIKAPAITSRSTFIATVDEIARIQVELRAAEAARDERIQAVRDEYEPRIVSLRDLRDGFTATAERYAEKNREELLPGKIKSADAPLATYGFRLGNPVLKLLNRAWTWDLVMGALIDRGLKHLVRVKSEPDKDAIKQLPASDLAAVGCRIEQAETFFIEPKDSPTE